MWTIFPTMAVSGNLIPPPLRSTLGGIQCVMNAAASNKDDVVLKMDDDGCNR